MSEPNACEACTEQSGYYRLEDGITGQAPRPPFHPNYKCTVQGNRLEPQQYNPATGAERPTYDPWAQEQNVWQFIAGSQESIEEQACRIIEFYEVNVGSMGEVTDAEGRYWIAVGPNVMNPDHQPSERIVPEEMYGGFKIDVVLRHNDGSIFYLPCVIGDAKTHTWPNGILQTGYAFPDGIGHHFIDKPQVPVEFIGAKLPEGLIDYEIVHIIVYD